ncbi:CaiB/BaiF CoA transferase family protein [Ramlibacter rhizophilus]|uniref:CaiB/BaiF CoA transferase family protein n=1 Tax=Ramlibacter rhizophilus TaxID=1781167 RepID=UPI001F0E2B03|nr:CoA transferase [Ramlibacter rhizophilus]
MGAPSSDARGALPLAGCTVIELGHSVAAPFAGQILADLGAEVIKVEKPAGDDARHWGPPFVDGAAATFQAINRGKRSLVLELRKPEDFARLNALIDARADVVLQNMRPGQVEALKLDAATLRGRKPALVYCNLGAFGPVGPLAGRPGYDPLMQAFGGIMSVVGEPGGAPVRVGPSIVDMGSGMWAALGIVSLLMRRQATGEGGVVDVSLFETAACWMTMYVTQFLAGGQLPGKLGSGQAGIVPYRAYRTRDGDLVVAAGNDKLFRALCEVVGHPEWAQDARFAGNAQRVGNAAALYALLEAVFATRTSDEWLERLDDAGIPCAPVQDVRQMLAHPQTEALGLMQQVPGSSIPLMGLPFSLDGQRPRPPGPPPRLGEMDSPTP